MHIATVYGVPFTVFRVLVRGVARVFIFFIPSLACGAVAVCCMSPFKRITPTYGATVASYVATVNSSGTVHV